MARDPRHIRPSEWRGETPLRITSRRAYVAELLTRAPSLSAIGIDPANLPDLSIGRDQEDTFNAVNTPRMTDAVARVLGQFADHGAIDPALVRDFIINLTSEGTAVGYAAQLQGYDWLLREGANFIPETGHHKATHDSPPSSSLGSPTTPGGRSSIPPPDLMRLVQHQIFAK